jgi:2'-5' RNA ligase
VVWVGMERGRAAREDGRTTLEDGCEPLGFPRERRPFSPSPDLGQGREGFRPDVSEFLHKQSGPDFARQGR